MLVSYYNFILLHKINSLKLFERIGKKRLPASLPVPEFNALYRDHGSYVSYIIMEKYRLGYVSALPLLLHVVLMSKKEDSVGGDPPAGY